MSGIPGIVYVLVNEAMPGIVKIGMTTDIDRRLRELDTTALPLPFDVFHASRVADMRRAESLIHQAFADRRIRAKREFFRIEPEQATAALLLAEIEDVTDRAQQEVLDTLDDSSARAVVTETRRRTARFDRVGLLPGTILTYVRDPSIDVAIKDARTVTYEGEDWSISGLTRHLLRTLESKDYQVNGWSYWKRDGVVLSELWRRHLEDLDAAAGRRDAYSGEPDLGQGSGEALLSGSVATA